MPQTLTLRSLLTSWCVFSLMVLPCCAQWDLSQMISTSAHGATYRAKPVPEELRNAWPAELEVEFQQRADAVIRMQTKQQKAGVNTYFENEKRTYGYLMAHALGGNHEVALRYLQAEDHQHDVWHRETSGIDFYACFTLKHQMRKYFYFGDLLDPEYRERMLAGAKRWTARDPLKRPHYAFVRGQQGWGPDAKNSWVDVRSTENLWWMRTSSVYLMAEETGNEQTRDLYRQQILNYVAALYRIGIGEWDSENYHGHSIAPMLNLYDFADDREVKAAAKACLDFFAAAGAVKYWRGGFNGPTKRDYNHAQPFGGSAANGLWMWFGDHPTGKANHWESDEVHQITSAYRPPLAVVHLARKQFERPVEILAAKPPYDATTRFRRTARPEYLETQYIAHSYQMGSLTGGTSVDGGDVNGFKILVYDQQRGAVALHAVPGANPEFPGSPMYKQGVVAAENRVAQFEHVALWLVQDGSSPWLWVVPADVDVREQDGVTFLKCDRTWVAIRSLGGTPLADDPHFTQQLSSNSKNRFPDHKVLSCRGQADAYCGLAIEVGEAESHESFPEFVATVLSAETNVDRLQEGYVEYRTSQGKQLAVDWNDDPLQLEVWRDGQRAVGPAAALYRSPIIQADWGGGWLQVTAGDARFRCEVDERGRATFAAGSVR